MAEMTKEEMLRIVNENIEKLENKNFNVYFFVLDTKGNPSESLEYIYQAALVLSKKGYNVIMLHQEKEFVGVSEWLGEEYANLKHLNIETDNINIGPSDFLFVPEIFANVLLQTKSMPLKRVVIIQDYSNITEFTPVSTTYDTLGITDAIVTSEKQGARAKEWFPNLRTHIVHPSVKGMFRDNEEPRKLIINIISREQSDVNKIVKPFYWKNPLYRWVSFRDLRGLSKEVMSEALREAAITIWIDDKTQFGTSLLEALRCGGLVIAKIPDEPSEWMADGDKLTDSVTWFQDINDLPNMIASVVRTWTMDKIPSEVYEKQKVAFAHYNEDDQDAEIEESYVKGLFERRLSEFKEAKADIENNVLKINGEEK